MNEFNPTFCFGKNVGDRGQQCGCRYQQGGNHFDMNKRCMFDQCAHHEAQHPPGPLSTQEPPSKMRRLNQEELLKLEIKLKQEQQKTLKLRLQLLRENNYVSSAILLLGKVGFKEACSSAGSVQSKKTAKFKNQLVAKYCPNRPNDRATCLLLHEDLPQSFIVGSHIFKRALAHLSSELLGFENIDDVRNGLLLFLPIETAFDRFQLCFVWKDIGFFCHILDKDLKELRLCQLMPQLRDHDAVPFAIRMKQFKDLEGQPLLLDTHDNGPGPFKQCLWFHANLARILAVSKGWIADSDFVVSNYGYGSTNFSSSKVIEWLIANNDLTGLAIEEEASSSD